MATELTWERVPAECGGGWSAQTSDGYRAGVGKINRSVDGYMASVIAPGWSYSSLFATPGRAKAWCRQIVGRDRKAPMTRPADA